MKKPNARKQPNKYRLNKSTSLLYAILIIGIIATLGLVVYRNSRASRGPHYLQNDFGGHNYGAAVMKDSAGEHYFWCGVNQYTNSSGQTALEEVVYYQHYNYLTGEYSKQYPTLQPRTTGKNAGWENNSHMCDPTIVEGNFSFEGSKYRYALYYDSDPDHSSRNTRIGVAFSNNISADPAKPTKWKFAKTPIICELGNLKNTYGAGTTSALIDPQDKSKVQLIYTDTSITGNFDIFIAESNNGYDFGWNSNCQYTKANRPKPINTNNLQLPGGDYAYDANNQWYYIVSGDPKNIRNTQKDGIPGGSVNELFQYIIARIKPEALTDPEKGGWQILGYLSSDNTKSYLNFNPAIERTGPGYLDTPLTDGVRRLNIWNSQIVPNNLVSNYSGVDADSALRNANFNDVKISKYQWIPGRVPIKRYVGGSGEHITTAGPKPKANYTYDNQTYYLLPGQRGPLWGPIYSCVTQGAFDYFLSTNSDCEGFLQLGLIGYSYRGPNAPNLTGRWERLYRCWNNIGNGSGENFMTISPVCENRGNPQESNFGWVSLDPSGNVFK